MQLTVPKSVALNAKYAATLKQGLTIGRIPGGEMYPPLKEFGKGQIKSASFALVAYLCNSRLQT